MGLAAAPAARVRRTYLDTYDWRLFARRQVLVLERGDDGDTLVLQDRGTGRSDVRVPVTGQPTTAGALPESLRQRIGAVVADRALIDVGHEETEVWPLRLFDEEGKTVARIDVERVTVASASPIVRVELSGVRGYERAARRVRGALDSQADLAPADDPLVAAARAAGAEPGVAPGAQPLLLSADEAAAAALVRTLEHQLDVMVALEDGVRRNLDPDLLHDFRIAIRRTRSVVRLADRHLPDKITQVWAPEWRWLAGVTGTPRDLDVLMAEIELARDPLGSELKGGLDELVEVVVRQRHTAQDKLLLALNGDRYGTVKRGWRFELDDVRTSTADVVAASSAADLAEELVTRATKQLAKHAMAVGPESPAESIHDVRKRAKRLRYALDLFGDLLPEPRVKAALKATKRLQDDLGEFQDAEVHSDLLSRVLDVRSQGLSPEAVAAGHQLIARYADRQGALRATVDDRLRRFREASHSR